VGKGAEMLREILNDLPDSFIKLEMKRSLRDDWEIMDERMKTVLEDG
jgi:hypothetical protein